MKKCNNISHGNIILCLQCHFLFLDRFACAHVRFSNIKSVKTVALCDRSQCLESHSMIDFVYKLQLHYNIYTLIFPIWMENIVKVNIPLGSCNVRHMQKETYHTIP